MALASKADAAPGLASLSLGESPNKEVLGKAYHAPIGKLAPLLAAVPEKVLRAGHLWTSVIIMLSSYFAALIHVDTKNNNGLR